MRAWTTHRRNVSGVVIDNALATSVTFRSRSRTSSTARRRNSAVYFEKQRRQGNEPPVIAGYRARWCDRGKLALAKHGHELTPTSTASELAGLILRAGMTSADDTFIEVHVHGPITRRTLARMTVARARASGAIVIDIRDHLERIGVPVEEA